LPFFRLTSLSAIDANIVHGSTLSYTFNSATAIEEEEVKNSGYNLHMNNAFSGLPAGITGANFLLSCVKSP
jgi:hypothetical protein